MIWWADWELTLSTSLLVWLAAHTEEEVEELEKKKGPVIVWALNRELAMLCLVQLSWEPLCYIISMAIYIFLL